MSNYRALIVILSLAGVGNVFGSLCEKPKCDKYEINSLWPHEEPGLYWRCAGLYEPEIMICESGLKFSSTRQSCIEHRYWERECIPEILDDEGINNCAEPDCEISEITKSLWPSNSGEYFWKCDKNISKIMVCVPGTLFSFDDQKCVPSIYWINNCGKIGKALCEEPVCETFEEINTLWPHIDKKFYWQCRPGTVGWVPQQMPCSPATFFSFKKQVCVHPGDWQDECNPKEPTTESSTETTIETTMKTTMETTIEPETTTELSTETTIETSPETTPETTMEPETTTDLSIETTSETSPETTEETTTLSSTTSGGSRLCLEPKCETLEEIEKLWPMPAPNFFWQCSPGADGWYAEKMPCGRLTWFSFEHQVCIWPDQWTRYCDLEEPTEPTSTSDTPTTIETTTETTLETSPGTIPSLPPFVTCEQPNCGFLQTSEIKWPSKTHNQFWLCVFFLETVWVPLLDQCPSGSKFNFSTQACVDPLEWKDICESISTEMTSPLTTPTTEPTLFPPSTPSIVICGSPRCFTPGERRIKWPSTVANTFYECQWVEILFQFVPIPKRCPEFLFFDYQKQDCVDPKVWDDICPIYPTLPPTTVRPPITLPLPIVCGEPRCDEPVEIAFLWPAETPPNYFECQIKPDGSYEPVILSCDSNLLFDVFKQKCVPKAEWQNMCPQFPSDPENPIIPTPPSPLSTTTEAQTEISLPINCGKPRCRTSTEVNILWPANQPLDYFKCVKNDVGTYYAVQKICEKDLFFDFFSQSCVSEKLWRNICPTFPDPENPILPTPPGPFHLF